MVNTIEARLHPEHLADLRKSDLSDKTILESSIKSVRPEDIDGIFGYPTYARSAYSLPYFGTEYSRYRMFYDEMDRNNPKTGESRPKYLAVKDSVNHLYIPHKVRPILNDLSIPLYITEGEKKSLKAVQDGLYCIAISGLWGWKIKSEDELIPDFDLIALDGRTIYIVPDSHFREPNRHGKQKYLWQAVYELAYRLIDKGAKVFWVELPKGDVEVKLDDYLCNHTAKDFRELPKHEIFGLEESLNRATPETKQEELYEMLRQISKIKSATKKDRYKNILHKKTGISKRAFSEEMKSLTKPSKWSSFKELSESGGGDCINDNMQDRDEEEKKLSAYFPGLVDLVAGDSGKVIYLVKVGDTLKTAESWEIDGTQYLPPGKPHLPFALARANYVFPHYEYDSDQKLFIDILSYLKRFSYLPNSQWLIVACNVFLGYLQDHPDIHYLPMILFFAVPERGKSRTGKAVTYISFRGVHVVDMREANLFRYSENLKATIFFDLMNLWKKAEKNGAEDILLLRYEKGAKVSRVIYPEKGAFKDTVYYGVYGSTIIATNEPVHKILGSRCIDIAMQNKPGNYENPTPEKAQELKERLTAWRARTMDKPLPKTNTIQGLGGRLWDIAKPLLQVCKLVYPQGFDSLKNALLEVAGQRVVDKKESVEGKIVEALNELSPKGLFEWNLSVSELAHFLNEDRPEEHKLTAQYIGRKLKAMSIHTHRSTGGHARAYLSRNDFGLLLEQYGFENISTPTAGNNVTNVTNLTSPTESRDSGSDVSVTDMGNVTITSLSESLVNTGKVRLVTNSEVSGGVREEKKENEEIPEVDFIEEVKTNV